MSRLIKALNQRHCTRLAILHNLNCLNKFAFFIPFDGESRTEREREASRRRMKILVSCILSWSPFLCSYNLVFLPLSEENENRFQFLKHCQECSSTFRNWKLPATRSALPAARSRFSTSLWSRGKVQRQSSSQYDDYLTSFPFK